MAMALFLRTKWDLRFRSADRRRLQRVQSVFQS